MNLSISIFKSSVQIFELKSKSTGNIQQKRPLENDVKIQFG